MRDEVVAAHEHAIDALASVSASLSLVGCTVVLATVVLSKRLSHVPALRVLVFVSALNWWVSVAYFLSPTHDAGTCQFVGFLQQFCHLSSALWMTCLAVSQHRGIVLGLPNADKFEVYFHLVCWLVPLATCVVLWGMRAIGEASDFTWCWIDDDEEAARWVLFHIPLCGCMLTTTAMIASVLRVLNTRRRKLLKDAPQATIFSRVDAAASNSRSAARGSVMSRDTISTANKSSTRHRCATVIHVELKVQRQMIYLTFAFVLLRVPWVCKAIQSAAHSRQDKGLVLAEAATSPLLGFLVFVLFICNSQVRRHFRRLRRKGWKGLKNLIRGRDRSRLTVMSDLGRANHRQGEREVPVDALASPRVSPAPPPPSSSALRVFVGSWNLGNAPPSDNLGEWIPTSGFDVWAIGVQESSWSADKRKPNAPNDFFGIVTDHMRQSSEQISTLAAVSLWDIRLVVFVRAALESRVSDVEMASEACGLGKVLGNKGAVGVCFNVGETCVCFVNSHLAAQASRVRQRNNNVRDILRGLRFRNRRVELSHQVHYFFWMGDLNYRINIPRDRAIAHIRNDELAPLLAADQLSKEGRAGRVFTGFHEGEITFTPTYRFERGSREFSNKKNQTPSYCDRVLFRVLPQGSLTQHAYHACHGIMSSDHSPVAATFTLQLLDAPRKAQVPRDDSAMSLRDRVQPTRPVDTDHPNVNVSPQPRQPPNIDMPTTYSVVVSDVHILHIHPLKHRVDGAADPYLRFVPSWVVNDGLLESPSLKRTIDPSWEGVQMPTMTFNGSFAQLCRQHVTMLCLDLGLRGEEDFLGGCVIPPSIGFGPEPVPFRALLTRQTRRVGAVFGRVHVVSYESDRSGSVQQAQPPRRAASATDLMAVFEHVGEQPPSDAEGEGEGEGDSSADEDGGQEQEPEQEPEAGGPGQVFGGEGDVELQGAVGVVGRRPAASLPAS